MFFFIFSSISHASCRNVLTKPVVFMEVGELCDIRGYVLKFKNMSEEQLLFEKKLLDATELQDFLENQESNLLKRWLVETGLKTNLAESSRDALVDYYFERFHKISDPSKFHVDHPLVIQSRLVKSYRDL